MRFLCFALICIITVAAAAWAAADPKTKVSDDKIYDEVRLRLASDAQVKGGALTVEVQDGIVTLSGKVRTEKQKARAERLTRRVKGVVKVLNKLYVEP
ncbi:MAG: BON domain-containing protein [Bryobacteraceae bacterium]